MSLLSASIAVQVHTFPYPKMPRFPVGTFFAEIFGKRVRELREKSGLSQEKLAQASNLTTFVSTIESGKKTPSLTAILKLGYGLKVHSSKLLSGFTFDVIRKLKL